MDVGCCIIVGVSIVMLLDWSMIEFYFFEFKEWIFLMFWKGLLFWIVGSDLRDFDCFGWK